MFTLLFCYVNQFILTAFTFPSVVQILEKHQKRFISDLDAKEIAGTLQRNGVIPEEIAADIANARSKTKANEVLYDHLQSQSSEDDLKRLFQLCREKKGYSVMNAFGTDILVELERRGELALALTLSRKLQPYKTANGCNSCWCYRWFH